MTKCTHRNLVPLEVKVGKRIYTSEQGQRIDWGANIINAHIIRVTKYYCTSCQEVIELHHSYDGKEE